MNEDSRAVPATYSDLTEKVEAYAEGIVGGGWLWVSWTVEGGFSMTDSGYSSSSREAV